MNLSTRAMMLHQLTNMTNEINTTTAAEPVTETQKNDSCFLGLYVPKGIKDKVAAAAKAEDRSMSKYAVRVFERHFANA